MTVAEMHIALKLELDKSDSLNNISFEPEELDYWINKAIKRFVKTRYSGVNIKMESFEETQKRTDDLRTLVSFSEILVTDGTDLPNSFIAALPASYWITLSEECEIIFNPTLSNLLTGVDSGDLQVGSYYYVLNNSVYHNGSTYQPGEYFEAANASYQMAATFLVDTIYDVGDIVQYNDAKYECILTTTDQIPTNTTYWTLLDEEEGYVVLLDRSLEGVTQADSNTYRRYLDDPYSEYNLYYYSAKPLRLFRGDNVILITDGNYYVTRYYLTYLKEPDYVDYYDSDDSDLPEHTHDEIIDTAALMMIENIESPRIQTQQAVSINE